MSAADGALVGALRGEMARLAAADPTSGVEASARAAIRGIGPFLRAAEVEVLVGRLLAEAAGLGPIEELLLDPEVDEVMINGPNDVWVERRGRLERTTVRFGSVDVLRDSVDRILGPAGRRADGTSPMADARLPDGSRVNVALPPLAVGGPLVTIRRFRRRPFDLADLERTGTLDPQLAGLLAAAVEDGLNVLVSGSTGSGKSTTLGALAALIPPAERVVTIEDAAELRIDHPHVVSLESRPATSGGVAAVTIRDLVRNALRMRPDRIVVGEVRGAEAVDMLDAMSTGHAGSLSTIHAGSPSGAVDRLAGLVARSGSGIPYGHAIDLVGEAIDLVVHQRREADGRRIVESVALVSGDGPTSVDEIFRVGEGGPVWRASGSAAARSRLRIR